MEQERPVCRDLTRAARRAAEGKPYKHLLRRARNAHRRRAELFKFKKPPLSLRLRVWMLQTIAAIQDAFTQKDPPPLLPEKPKRPRWMRYPNPAVKVEDRRVRRTAS